MVELRTRYLGLDLSSPLVASAEVCELTGWLDLHTWPEGDVPRRGCKSVSPCGSASGSLCRHELGWRHLLGGWGEQGHGAFGEVAPVADLPFVVGFDQHRSGQTKERLGVGEHPHDVGAALDFLVEPLQRVG
jgi:hypothetical protein